jgi:hypothetical protein
VIGNPSAFRGGRSVPSGTLAVVSEQRHRADGLSAASLTIEELARAQHASQVTTAEELAADIWESDEELDEFLADFRTSRDASTT